MENELFQNLFIEHMRIDKQCKETQNSSSTSTVKQYIPYNLRAIQKRMMFE
jgi:hypothetical protein